MEKRFIWMILWPLIRICLNIRCLSLMELSINASIWLKRVWMVSMGKEISVGLILYIRVKATLPNHWNGTVFVPLPSVCWQNCICIRLKKRILLRRTLFIIRRYGITVWVSFVQGELKRPVLLWISQSMRDHGVSCFQRPRIIVRTISPLLSMIIAKSRRTM